MRLSTPLLLLTALTLGGRSGQAQSKTDATERRIVKAVDADSARAVALLERVVNINSGTMNFEGVRQVGAVFRAELDGLGFSTKWIDGAGFGRAGHLVAEHPGHGTKLLLIGHLDTVFEKDSPFQRFERVDATHARGPGIIDMKGGDVIMIQALKALKAAGVLDGLDVTIVMTGDEEKSGDPLLVARQALIDAARRADVAIGFEDGPGDPARAVVARRGYTGWELTVTGTPAHSSQIFREDIGPGAIFETARVLDAFRTRLAGEQYLTFNPGVALGGTAVALDSTDDRGTASGKANVVAEHMAVTGDLRTLSADQLARTKATMQAIVDASLPHTHSTIEFRDGYPPLAPAKGNLQLLSLYDQVSRDLGFEAVRATDPSAAGAADVSFTAGLVSMAIDGVGLAGSDDHTEKETADLSTLPRLTKRAALLFYRLGRRQVAGQTGG
jgi:glutamate carboxypeptidase